MVNNEMAFKYICSTLIPTILKSGIYTYIAYYTGYYGSCINSVLITLVSILTPVTPNINWFFTGIIESLTPVILFFMINYEIYSRETNISKRKIRRESPIKLIPLLVFTIIFILFIVGVFKYMPVAVMSNSMQPLFGRGSVVIVKKVQEEDLKNLKVGDIIEYSIDNKVVLHRIIEIVDSNKYTFRTKGDNNKSDDNKLVLASHISGIIVFSFSSSDKFDHLIYSSEY